jgi:hypothetical protein
MKFNMLAVVVFFITTLTGVAQHTSNQKETDSPYFSLTFGLNMIDNSNGNFLPFDGKALNFKSPFFLTAEQRINNRWSLALNASTNKLTLDNPASTKPYFSADIFANLFVDDVIFNTKDIDLYIGLGLGLHTLNGSSANTFNIGGGFRYWISNNVALSLQSIGKINKNGIAQVGNHYQFNLGVAYKFAKKETNSTRDRLPQTDEAILVSSEEPKVINQESRNPLDEDRINTEKKRIPEYNPNIQATSTDLAENEEEKEIIRKNAAAILNTKTLNNEEASKTNTFHVIIYSFRKQRNLDNMIQVLSEKNMEVSVIKDVLKNFNYISIAQFNTKEEAYNYIDNSLDKEQFVGSWVYELSK